MRLAAARARTVLSANVKTGGPCCTRMIDRSKNACLREYPACRGTPQRGVASLESIVPRTTRPHRYSPRTGGISVLARRRWPCSVRHQERPNQSSQYRGNKLCITDFLLPASSHYHPYSLCSRGTLLSTFLIRANLITSMLRNIHFHSNSATSTAVAATTRSTFIPAIINQLKAHIQPRHGGACQGRAWRGGVARKGVARLVLAAM